MEKQTTGEITRFPVDTCVRKGTHRQTLMCNTHRFHTHFLLVLAIFLFGICPIVHAQSQEEMRMLELFYEAKDLVITPTRYPKPINQVAENITVIYSEDIDAMNAHTVAEVLRWIPGMFINTSQDFGATSLLSIQGSEDRHVTVLLDGTRWNFLSGGNAETNTIPVGIIDRIEVIKGPASSAWGSSLGGIVNIITKHAARKNPGGEVYGSYGKANSLDARAQVFGSGETFGYFLYAGRQESDGLQDGREMDTISLFSKFNVDLSRNAGLNISLGYSEPDNDLGSYPSADIRSNFKVRTVYANAALDIDLASRSNFNISGYYISQEGDITYNALGLGMIGAAGDLFRASAYHDKTFGAAANLVWEPDGHTVVTGAEVSRGTLDQAVRVGDLLQMFGVPALTESRPDIVSWAVYINDTLSLGRWSVTPGVRFDYNTVSNSFFSPSLGVTFQPRSNLLFRGTISRGFHYPPLSYSEGGGFFLDPNPDLEAEEVWSYQAGIETTAIHRIRVKTTLFLHDLSKALFRELYGGGPPNYNDLFLNSENLQRRGVEVDLKTDSIHNVSFEASGVYVHFDKPNIVGATESFAYNLILSYDHPDIITARLAGHYEDLNATDDYASNFDDIIWDLHISRDLIFGDETKLRLFITAHNLLSGNQYIFGDTRNPKHWYEIGMRFLF